MRPIRVLYASHTAALGGSLGSLRLTVEHCPPGSIEASVLMPPGPAVEHLRRAGIAVYEVPAVAMLAGIWGLPLRGARLLHVPRAVWNARYGRRVRAVLKEVRPDIVHLNERGMYQVARSAARARIPVVMHARSVADRTVQWERNLLAVMVRRYVTRVIAIDESVRQSLRELDQVDVVYNPLPPLQAQALHRHQSRGAVVAYVSGLIVAKGVADLVQAAALLRHRRDITFRIAGANSRSERFYRSLPGRISDALELAMDVEARLRRLVARENLGSTVQLLGHVDAPAEILATADVLAFPSHTNGVSRSVYEAGVLGIPSVVSLRDPVQDIVEDGGTGLIVRPHAPGELARAIALLADDPDLRARMGARASERYVMQFAPQRAAEQTLAIYERILAKRTRRST